MTILIVQFLVLAAIIVAGGTLLAKTADRIGQLTGLGGSLAGFLLLASATSLPELVIDAQAAWLDAADLAIGDLLGSSLFNLLILGVIDLTHRRPMRILSSVSAAHALSAATSIVLTSIILLSMLVRAPGELLGIGVGPWAIGIVYLFSVRLIYIDQKAAASSVVVAENSAAVGSGSLKTYVLAFAGGTLLVLLCGPLLVRVADALAIESGLGGTIIGTTFVALTTSLPEITTTLTAVRLGAYSLAAGNIFGSNCFNIAILPIVDLCYRPGPVLHSVSPNHAITATAVILITGIAMMGLLYRAKKRYWLVEPDALLVVVLAVAALALIIAVNGG